MPVIPHHLFDIVAGVVLVCSLVGSILPPFEVFSFSPRFQNIYRILVIFVSTIGALNFRNLLIKMYPSYQQKNGDTNVPNAKMEKPPASPATPTK